MRAAAIVALLHLRRLARTRWLALAAAAGVLGAGLVALSAAGDEGAARSDTLQEGSTTLLLLGGLALAVALGAGALNRDSDSGHFGLLMGAGAGRPSIVVGTLVPRLVALCAVVAVWGAALLAAGGALGRGVDADLALHTAIVSLGLAMTLAATAAASSMVGRVAAGVFGVSVYVTAQAMMNLKAAADQDLIGTARGGINAAHLLVPHVPTSPMLADLQARDAAGPAIPRIDINGNEVLLSASGAASMLWTIAWVAGFGLLAYAGMRRRPIV
jgi:hypothetical protein